jgi:hypothetical protein
MSLAHVTPNRMMANFLIVSNLPSSGPVRTWGPMQFGGQPLLYDVGLFREGATVLVEKRLDFDGETLDLQRGDQDRPDYAKLNPDEEDQKETCSRFFRGAQNEDYPADGL